MKRSRFTEQQIVTASKEADCGISVEISGRRHGMSRDTQYQWKSKDGRLETSDLKRMRKLEAENAKAENVVNQRTQRPDLGKR